MDTHRHRDESTQKEGKENDGDMIRVANGCQEVFIESRLETVVDVTGNNACTHKDARKERKLNLYM